MKPSILPLLTLLLLLCRLIHATGPCGVIFKNCNEATPDCLQLPGWTDKLLHLSPLPITLFATSNCSTEPDTVPPLESQLIAEPADKAEKTPYQAGTFTYVQGIILHRALHPREQLDFWRESGTQACKASLTMTTGYTYTDDVEDSQRVMMPKYPVGECIPILWSNRWSFAMWSIRPVGK